MTGSDNNLLEHTTDQLDQLLEMAGSPRLYDGNGRRIAADNPLPTLPAAIHEFANLGGLAVAKDLFLATVAGSATLSKLKWPGAYTVNLPLVESGDVANLTESGAVVGGVFAPKKSWGSVLLDFAGVGAADATTVIEIGLLHVAGPLSASILGTMPQILSSASLKSITTAGTWTANFNPFTGAVVASTTFRLYDLVTLTNRSNLAEVLTAEGGAEDNTPARLLLDVTSAPYYYVLVTTLGVATSVLCCLTPQP